MHTLNHPFFKNFLKNFFLNEKKPPIFLVTEVNRRRVEIFIILVYNRKSRERQIVKETIGVGVNEKAVLRFYKTALSFTSISIFPW